MFVKPRTKTFVEQQGLEKELVHPLLESHNIDRWRHTWNPNDDLFVLYPHVERDGKVMPADLESFPRAKEYLESKRSQLESRTYLSESGRRWYEIWVHQSPSDFHQRKIVTPDISSYNRFALVDEPFFVNGTCFYIILKAKSDNTYFSILGLLNSKVIEYFHKVTSGNSLYAKRFRYWTSYVGNYPVADRLFDSPELSSAVVKNVSRLLNSISEKEQMEFEEENDRLCYKLFDLTADEIQEIESAQSCRGFHAIVRCNA